MAAVLYPGGEAADNPEVLGCAENALGLREFLEGGGHELVSTTERVVRLCLVTSGVLRSPRQSEAI